MNAETTVNLAGVQLQHPLMNAAGTCKLLDGSEGVKNLARSATAAVMVGSITLEPRTGNSGDVYWASDVYSLNSLGLPNPGVPYYSKHLPEMVDVAHKADKPLFVSVAGFSPDEYATLAEVARNGGADLIELNLGCPNVWQGSQQKRIACFDSRLVEDILGRVEERIGVNNRVSVKISPFSDPFSLNEVAQVVGRFGLVKAVTSINTFPNSFSCDSNGKPRIAPGGGLAGLAGCAVKPIGLGQVKQLRDCLPAHIQIVGVGGISSGQDILDYQRVGATAVQIATAFLERREQVFSSLLAELVEVSGE